jgi:hypothetical protein
MINLTLRFQGNAQTQKKPTAPKTNVNVKDKPKAKEGEPTPNNQPATGLPIQKPVSEEKKQEQPTQKEGPVCPHTGLPIKKPQQKDAPASKGLPVKKEDQKEDEDNLPSVDPNKSYSVC